MLQRDASHLELRDGYFVPGEQGPFQRRLNGDDADYSCLEPWTQLMQQTTGRGMTVRRVRMVTEPTDPLLQLESAFDACGNKDLGNPHSPWSEALSASVISCWTPTQGEEPPGESQRLAALSGDRRRGGETG
ncbi:DUF6879 family protein [Streptomyces sp. NPDC059862]|uniref:DUF6879 family protein n=1 Tax=Streptomyces sp. NPDC059862 TaxID=3346975 RepID=UPI0036600137